MTSADAKKRIDKLRDQIEDLRYRYHVLNDPKVTDDVKDSLEKELKALEQENQRLKSMYANLSLDHSILKEVIEKKFPEILDED